MRLFILSLMLASFISCKKEQDNNSFEPKKLGEDIKEINAFIKNIYRQNEHLYVDLDVIQIKYSKEGSREIINKNNKIRTYEIDDKTLIYSNECKTLNQKELLEIKNTLLSNSTIILVGQSKNGKMVSINFGCYG